MARVRRFWLPVNLPPIPKAQWITARCPYLLAAALALGGCRGGASRLAARSEILAAVGRPSGLPPPSEPKGPLDRADEGAGEPAGSLDQEAFDGGLAALLAAAERTNPELAQRRAAARAVAEQVVRVTSLPDPQLLTKTLPEPIRTAEGDNHFILSVSQRIPAPEKLDRAGRVALEELRMAIHALEETGWRVRAEVKRAWYRLYEVRETTKTLHADRELLSALIEVARAQLRAGRRSQADILRGEVELASLEARLIELTTEDRNTVAAINALLNRPPASVINDPPEPVLPEEALPFEALRERASRQNPSLARVARQVERDRESLELAKLVGVPDFTLGFEWMSMEPRDAFEPPRKPGEPRPAVSQLSEDGSDNWGVIFGMTLPIWYDRNTAIVRQAEHRFAASRRERTLTMRTIERDCFAAHQRYESWHKLALLYRDTIIPQAEQTYRVSLAEYRAATTGFDVVIDDHRDWLSLSIDYYHALSEAAIALADLEQVTGSRLDQP